MAVDFQHADYKKNLPRWKMAENICTSTDAEQYLVELNPDDDSKENATRNKQYRERAVLYPLTGHTLQGFIGLAFGKDPELKTPASLDYIKANIDGGGASIYQQSQEVVGDIEKKGRAGLLVSYPKTQGPLSRADMDAGKYLATVTKIDAEQIINWRTMTVGAKIILSLIVIMEAVEAVGEDGFSISAVEQIRELSLVEGVYTVTLWRKNERKEWVIFEEPTQPTDSTGNVWREIPFVFVGSMTNSHKVNDAPLYPMAKVNIAHYRNSADYEDSVWYAGQAQPWMSGITQTHLDLMKSNKMYVGSRNLIGVPSGEQFGFASAEPNTMVRQAMLDKLDMMIGMGARHIQGMGPAKTAEEAGNNARAQYSSLTMVCKNVSEAYTKALGFMAQYMGATGEIEYKINDDFIDQTATAQDIQAMVAGFIQGAIPMSAYLGWMKKVGLEDNEKTLDQFAEEVGQPGMPNLDQGMTGMETGNA